MSKRLMYLMLSIASAFHSKTQLSSGHPVSWAWRQEMGAKWGPKIQGQMVIDLLHHLDIHRSSRLDRIHPRLLRELTEQSHFPSFVSTPGWLGRSQLPGGQQMWHLSARRAWRMILLIWYNCRPVRLEERGLTGFLCFTAWQEMEERWHTASSSR